MNVLVIGATGGSGRAAVGELLSRGHQVTAFCRSRSAFSPTPENLRVFPGDVLDPSDVERAVPGHDAVIVTLGISENPVRVRLRGPRGTAPDVRSRGTRAVIAAMERHGVRRLVVQTSYGVGTTRDRLAFVDRLIFALLLRPQIADTELQEMAVTGSSLDWLVVQPVHLRDAPEDDPPFISTSGDVQGRSVSRRSVGRFLAEAVSRPDLVRTSVALSGAVSVPAPTEARRLTRAG